MTIAVRVSATVTGHRRRGVREHDLVLALPPGAVTARQLIEAAVAAEVAGPASHRYDGHQVQPGQARALLSSRGWVTAHETADAARAFHAHGLVARDHEIKDLTILEQLLPGGTTPIPPDVGVGGPDRSYLPRGRPLVPPDVGVGGPDRKNRDVIRPAHTDKSGVVPLGQFKALLVGQFKE